MDLYGRVNHFERCEHQLISVLSEGYKEVVTEVQSSRYCVLQTKPTKYCLLQTIAMGGTLSTQIESHVLTQFEKSCSVSGLDQLTIDDILLLQCPTDYVVDFCHLGTLFVLDAERRGRISSGDLLIFAQWCAKCDVQTSVVLNFQDSVRGNASYSLVQFLKKKEHRAEFADWFLDLFVYGSRMDRAVLEFDKHPDVEYTSSDIVQTIHKVLHIGTVMHMDFQSFLYMLQQAGEETKVMELDDEGFDEVVPIEVLREFALQWADGFCSRAEYWGMEQPDHAPKLKPVPAPSGEQRS